MKSHTSAVSSSTFSNGSAERSGLHANRIQDGEVADNSPASYFLSLVTTFLSNELMRKIEWMEITKQKLHGAINHYKNKITGCPRFPCSYLFNQKHQNLTSILKRKTSKGNFKF